MRKIIGMCVLMLVLVGVYSYRSDVRAEEVVTKELYTLVKPVALDKAGLSRGIYYDRQDLGIIMPAGEELEIRQVDPNYSLPEAQKQASVEQYQEILPPLLDTTAETTDFVGNYFRFLLLGLGDNKFASIDLDLANNKAKLWVSDEDPHAYFADAYATMQLKDELGNVIYAQDYIGNISNPAELNKTFAVEPGYYISVMHKEANTRLKMKNTESNETIPSQIENHFKITATGLQNVKKEDIPKPTENQLKYYGDQYDFSLYGLGDNKFASMDLDLVKGQAKLWVSGEEPHDYFADAYATMQLKDEFGNVIYAQDYIGNISNPAELNKTFAVEPGYYISVMHKEANTRLKMKNTESNETIPSQIENHFKITATGLQNVKKEDIPKPTENQLKYYGDQYDFSLYGLGDNKFASMDLDLVKGQAKLWVSGEEPHDYFADAYATMQLKDELGNVIYAQDYIGNISNPAELNKTFAVEPGYYISVMHKEANTRLKMKNTESNETIPSQIENHFKITATGLQNVKKEDIPKPTENQLKYYGDQYDFSLYGLGDNKFASMDLDLVKGQVKLWVSDEEPHVYFQDSYATIKIEDATGNVIFAKDFLGNVANTELNETLPIESGSLITIMHREAASRLVIQDVSVGSKLLVKETVTYQVTSTGLRLITSK